MRPVNRPNEDFPYVRHIRTTNSGLLGTTNQTRCIALCLVHEMNRIAPLLTPPEVQVFDEIRNVIDRLPIPVTIPAIDGHLNGFSYDQRLNQLNNVINCARVDVLLHYSIIKKNIQYNFLTNQFGVIDPILMIEDIPYAIGVMQNVIPQIGYIKGRRNDRFIFSFNPFPNPPLVGTGVVPAGVQPLVYFSWNDIQIMIREMYGELNDPDIDGAFQDLLNLLGPYCAYCESNEKVGLQVEHMMPKGFDEGLDHLTSFSSLSRAWSNFLPACGQCNSHKGNHPNKFTLTRATRGVNFHKDDLVSNSIVDFNPVGNQWDRRFNDHEYLRLLEVGHQFPLESSSYRNVGFVLMNVSTGLPENGPISNLINVRVDRIDEINKCVVVQYLNPGNRNQVVGQAHFVLFVHTGQNGNPPAQNPVIPNLPGLGTLHGAQVKVNNMVDLISLNLNQGRDRRTLERTEAWFMALQSIGELQSFLQPFNGNAPLIQINYDIWKTNLVKAIKEKGFFTVWLKVLSQFPSPTGGLIGQDIAQNLRAQRYFPGTDWTQVP